MVGLGPTIHEFRWATCSAAGKLVDGRAKHDHDGVAVDRWGTPSMILGIGNDMIDIRRVERSIERWGTRFLDRIFTEVERAKSDRRAQRAASYAKRFAAKEACAKALGTGLNAGVFWRDMGVVNLPSGKPTIALTGTAARHLERLTPQGCRAQIDVSLTDDFPLAQAIVIISAVPE
jgi:holo-[acyl-carrier protein] synthase